MSRVRATIVMLSHNRLDELAKNLAPMLQWLAEEAVELIVVDNASTDGAREYLRTVPENDRLRVILNGENLGVAAGRNAAYRAARGRYVINLDDDTSMDRSIVGGTIAWFQRRPEAGILAYRVRHPVKMEWQNPHGEEPCEVANFHGAGHAFRREVFEKAGYLDEKCRFGGEELEMSIRARAHGFTTLYVPDLVVVHNSAVRAQPIMLERLLQWRYNYARIVYKFFPRAMARRLCLRNLVRDLVRGLKGCLRGNLSWHPMLLVRSVLRGRQDGLREHTAVPPEVVRFYDRPDLRPEFGNRPLSVFPCLCFSPNRSGVPTPTAQGGNYRRESRPAE